ncbi:efflux RND transporter periplasmic adaptor subunit [Paucimonas lemoignei]
MISALVGCGVAANSYFGKKNAEPLNTVTVSRGDVEKTVTSLGKLKPKDYVDVGTQVSGQLKKVHVQIGDRVKKGDLIAEVDPTVYETKIRTGNANLENLRAQLQQQQAEASLAQQQYERNRDLLKERAISQETVESNLSALKVAKARVVATQAQIKASQATLDGDTANLGYTKIYAPMAGTVVSQTTLQGQTVNANQAAPVIVRVANLDTMTVWAQVAEADITKVKAGAPAYFTTLGNAEQRWKGTVRQVMPTPETVNDVVLYNVLVDVDNSQQALMTDMTVQVFFVLEQAQDAVLVPLAALRQEPGNDPSLYRARVVTNEGVASRTVKVGVANRTTAAVVSGLDVGDKVVAAQAGSAKSAGNRPSGGQRGGAGMGPKL